MESAYRYHDLMLGACLELVGATRRSSSSPITASTPTTSGPAPSERAGRSRGRAPSVRHPRHEGPGIRSTSGSRGGRAGRRAHDPALFGLPAGEDMAGPLWRRPSWSFRRSRPSRRGRRWKGRPVRTRPSKGRSLGRAGSLRELEAGHVYLSAHEPSERAAVAMRESLFNLARVYLSTSRRARGHPPDGVRLRDGAGLSCSTAVIFPRPTACPGGWRTPSWSPTRSARTWWGKPARRPPPGGLLLDLDLPDDRWARVLDRHRPRRDPAARGSADPRPGLNLEVGATRRSRDRTPRGALVDPENARAWNGIAEIQISARSTSRRPRRPSRPSRAGTTTRGVLPDRRRDAPAGMVDRAEQASTWP